MKKILLPGIVCILFFSMCKGDVDYVYTAKYVYQNNTSWDLTVKSYSPMYDNGKWLYSRDSIFHIPRGRSFEVAQRFGVTGTHEPLHWNGYVGKRDSTIVSNGTEQVVYRYWEDGNLYFQENYTLIGEGKRSWTYRYIFTDADFADAEPVLD